MNGGMNGIGWWGFFVCFSVLWPAQVWGMDAGWD